MSGCVFKQVHTSCSSFRQRTFSLALHEEHEFSVFIARECFVSQMKSPYHSLTLLTYIFAIILAPGPPVSPTQAPCPPFWFAFFCTRLVLFVLANGDDPRRFFAGTISTHSNSTRIILTLFVFNTAKHIAIGISKSLRTICTGRPSLRPSPSNHHASFSCFHNGHVSGTCLSPFFQTPPVIWRP